MVFSSIFTSFDSSDNYQRHVLNGIVMGNEIWIYAYDLETIDQWSEYRAQGEPRSQKRRESRSKIKAMLSFFFDYRGVAHYEYLSPEQIGFKGYFLNIVMAVKVI